MNAVDDLLEKTCKNMIQTILSCLDDATKGTIYRIGPMPRLQAVRVTSGVRVEGTNEIRWGLPSVSDYNYPGKDWEQYRDYPGRALEAMGWCVEKQRSWTADNPFEDVRSVRKQLRGEIEDFHHMEPVLVRKVDLYGGPLPHLEYPRDWQDNPIWQDTEYVVAAVIKIHFLPHTLRQEDRSTKVIKELSRSLGTELLSLHARDRLLLAQKELARQRLHSCQILAHELRNTLAKLGFIFSAINAQIGIIREEWEWRIQEAFPHLEGKGVVLVRLQGLLHDLMREAANRDSLRELCTQLMAEQQELSDISLHPAQGEQWILHRIQPKWDRLLMESGIQADERDEIKGLLERLRKSLFLGMDQELASSMPLLSADLKAAWLRFAYSQFSANNLSLLKEIVEFLEKPEVPIPHRQQIAKVLKSLKALVELVPEVEGRANRIILSLRNGGPSGDDAVQDEDRLWGAVDTGLSIVGLRDSFSISE